MNAKNNFFFSFNSKQNGIQKAKKKKEFAKAIKKNPKMQKALNEHIGATLMNNKAKGKVDGQTKEKIDNSEREKRMIIIDGSNIAYG